MHSPIAWAGRLWAGVGVLILSALCLVEILLLEQLSHSMALPLPFALINHAFHDSYCLIAFQMGYFWVVTL